ncbi:DUF6152 family protein [Rhizobium sp. BT-175]|uniref:DUF6152 family protein n=1 Tax=Rhizobium sp. BT-175 TaxID=2986929 RepID=UPI002235D70B|nr:DUF6152 family protein [Rhizobium sp. BT-175]MCV9947601.1 DUF6152 family protein [Rhizobium sp. BT-175]
MPMVKISFSRKLAAALGALALSGSAVSAHHGVTGRYDTSKPIVLAGVVARTTFSPPHPVISVRVEAADPASVKADRPDEFTGPFIVRPDDVGQVREIEFSPVQTFFDLGDRVRVGDRVLVLALRNCLPPHQLRSSWIQLADSEVVSYAGGLHRRAHGCN